MNHAGRFYHRIRFQLGRRPWDIGVPHPDFGEAVVAVVVRDGTVEVSDGQLADGLDEVLARFKHPKIYIAVDQLPRNAMSKVQKAALRGDHAKLFID